MIAALLLASAVAAPAPVATPVEIRQFQGGIYDGLRFQRTVASDGTATFEIVPAIPDHSPPVERLRRPIAGLIHALRTGAPADFLSVATPEAQVTLALDGCRLAHEVSDAPACTPQPLAELSFGEECRESTPYQMEDGVIRIEWSCGGELSYISWFTFRGDKVVSGELKPAFVPTFLGS